MPIFILPILLLLLPPYYYSLRNDPFIFVTICHRLDYQLVSFLKLSQNRHKVVTKCIKKRGYPKINLFLIKQKGNIIFYNS
jgi:hypothetical protein